MTSVSPVSRHDIGEGFPPVSVGYGRLADRGESDDTWRRAGGNLPPTGWFRNLELRGHHLPSPRRSVTSRSTGPADQRSRWPSGHCTTSASKAVELPSPK